MINKITHEGELNLNGLLIPCYVLANGERVLSTSGMQKALGVMDNEPKQRSSGRLDEIMTSKLITHVTSVENNAARYQPIECWRGRQKITAYDAVILPEICELMLKGRDHAKENDIELGTRQKAVINQSDIIIRALARIGIIALVDEATGYQYDREKDELQKILSSYISTELLPWQKRFPDEFYKEIFRLHNWDFTVNGIKNRPGVIGTWTKQLVYNLLPQGILQELEKKTPKNSSGRKTARLHQSLTLDIGEPHLEKQLISIITLMNVSKTWKEFIKLFGKKYGQKMMDLPEIRAKEKEDKRKTDAGGVQVNLFDRQLKANLKVHKPSSLVIEPESKNIELLD